MHHLDGCLHAVRWGRGEAHRPNKTGVQRGRGQHLRPLAACLCLPLGASPPFSSSPPCNRWVRSLSKSLRTTRAAGCWSARSASGGRLPRSRQTPAARPAARRGQGGVGSQQAGAQEVCAQLQLSHEHRQAQGRRACTWKPAGKQALATRIPTQHPPTRDASPAGCLLGWAAWAEGRKGRGGVSVTTAVAAIPTKASIQRHPMHSLTTHHGYIRVCHSNGARHHLHGQVTWGGGGAGRSWDASSCPRGAGTHAAP